MNPAKNNIAEDVSAREIVMERVLNAPRALVWKAMTDPAQVVKWWGPNGFSTKIEKMEFRVGGTWQHVMTAADGSNFPNKSVFTEIVENERISYAHSGGKEGTPIEEFVPKHFTWTFEDAGPGKTKLTGRMVFHSVAARDKMVKEFGVVEGGQQTLARFDDYLATIQGKPFIISRVFKAPLPLAFKVWTEKEHFMHWYGPKGFKMKAGTFDFRPGGTFHYCMTTPQGQEMWGKAYYRDIVPEKRIVMLTTFSDKDGGLGRHPFNTEWPPKMLTVISFEAHPEGTKITINWTPFEATASEQKVFDDNHASMNGGWGGTFEQLESYLAQMQK